MNTETLRDLVVSLSLDSGDFEKHIRLINKTVKEFESEFNLAAAGIDNFETSVKGMGEKAKLLKKQLSAQSEIAGQYAKKLEKLNEKLTENRARHTSLSSLIEKETAARDALKAKVDEQRKEVIKLTQAYGEDDQRVKDARDALAEYSGALDDANKAVKSAEGKLTAVQKNIYSVGLAINDTNASLNNAKAKIKELTQELARNESALYKHGVAMQAYADRARGAAEGFDRVGSSLTLAITTPLIGAGAAATKAAIDFESAFAGVRKTVNVAEKEADEFFETLSNSAIQMSKTLATSASDVSDVMAIAGQLGIAKESLDEFTEVVLRMGMSTNMSTEDAATQMARFANITGMVIDEYNSLGSAVVYLGNNFATTEGEIMAMAMRIAAAGTQVGLSESSILGFSAALSALGLEAEAGGSAFSKALKKMETAVATGGNALADFAKVSGVTQEQFKELWKNNPADAFQAFIVGLSKMDEAGISAIATLDEIGISEIRLSDTLLRSANATELIAEAQLAANDAWEKGEALNKESNTRLETMASRLENIKNTLVATGISFGETMMPTVEKGVSWVEELTEKFSELDDETRENIITWGLYAAASGPVLKGLGKIGTTVTSGIDLMGKFAQRIGEANAAFKVTGQMTSWITTLLGSGGGLMLGITAAVAALAGLVSWYKSVEAAKPDLSIDTSKLEDYKIDIDALQTTVEVNAGVSVTGDILSLKEKFVGILNDGVPETTDIRNEMQGDVDEAVGEVFKLIDESYNQKKAELDALFTNGVIDQTTYNTAMTTLNTQADAMRADLTGKADAVTAYVTTLCDANRKMTEEEIAALNGLLESLGATTEQIELALSTQMQAYELAYDKTRLGMGTEDDAKNAVAYIELKAQQEIDKINAQKEALDAVYAATTKDATDSEKQEAFAQLNKEQEALNQQIAEIEQAKQTDVANLTRTMIEEADGALAALHKWFVTKKEFESGEFEFAGVKYNWNALGDLITVSDYAGDMEEAIKELEPHLTEGSPLMTFLATLQANGLLPEGSLDSTESTLNTLVSLMQTAEEGGIGLIESIQEAAEGAMSKGEEVMDGKKLGTNLMEGISKGISDGVGSVEKTMRWAMGRITAVAKDELEIHSPSRVFENEVGAQTMKGFGIGATEELGKQEKLMANAMRHMTGEMQGAAIGGTDNRKTYNTENSVNVTVERLEVRDQQDIQSLATEIASLTRTQQRGRGVRYA